MAYQDTLADLPEYFGTDTVRSLHLLTGQAI
jgi:hypothetical protein